MRGPSVAAAVAAAAVALGAAACGSEGHVAEGEGSIQQGKTLFTERCGSCHVLTDAGTQGTIGPNLDEAFDDPRAQGFDESTIRDVVRGQISYPVEDPVTDQPGMPAIDVTLPQCGEGVEPGTNGCVEDSDTAADAIAAYVASVAGTGAPAGGGQAAGGGGAAGGTEPAGKSVFMSAGCGSCHTLADAGTTGTIGPNLDEAKPDKALVEERVRNGMGAMPSFEGQLTDEQIEMVADYVSSVAGM
jgi:mono/diheme cytochrome c family protein